MADPGAEVFRRSKILPEAEARMVVDKLQNPLRPDSHYVERLYHKGVDVQRDAIAKVFAKWEIERWSSAFTSTLSRLEDEVDVEDDPPSGLA